MGCGLVPECLNKIVEEYGFGKLGLTTIYGAYFDGNVRSKRVMEKCKFKYSHTLHNISCTIKAVFRTEHVMFITKDKFLGK